MSEIEKKLESLGLVLPAPLSVPASVKLPFEMVKRTNKTLYISGHGPLNADGTVSDIRGKVGAEVSPEEAYDAAKLTALAILASIKRSGVDLDSVHWLKALGMVNTAPGFNHTPSIINGFSDLILELYGAEQGSHARSAIGVAELPFDIPVEIEVVAELKL